MRDHCAVWRRLNVYMHAFDFTQGSTGPSPGCSGSLGHMLSFFSFFFFNTTGLKVRPPGLGGWLGNTNALCGWILSSWWVAEHVCWSCFLSDVSNLTDVTVQYVQSHWSQNNSELEKENRSDRKQHFFFFFLGGGRKGGCEEPLDDFTDI